jgi:hypothetical protein
MNCDPAQIFDKFKKTVCSGLSQQWRLNRFGTPVTTARGRLGFIKNCVSHKSHESSRKPADHSCEFVRFVARSFVGFGCGLAAVGHPALYLCVRLFLPIAHGKIHASPEESNAEAVRRKDAKERMQGSGCC